MLQRKIIHNPAPNFQTELQLLISALKSNVQQSVAVGLNVFISAISDAEYIHKSQLINSAVADINANLSTNVIAQATVSHMVAELWVHNAAQNVRSMKYKSVNYVTYTDTFGYNVFALGLKSSIYGRSLVEQSNDSFLLMKSILDLEGLTMDELVRQWNYIPGILCEQEIDFQCFQHYQQFNDVRQRVYHAYKKTHTYPAATGIGVSNGNVVIDFLALKPHKNTKVTGLANPQQIDAFDYSQRQLVGSNVDKKPPLFARANCVSNANGGLVFISGTASIIGEETKGIGDIEMQTNITIDNIEKLVSAASLSKVDATTDIQSYFSFHRVYIKNTNDFEKVRTICEQRFGNVPIIYVQADVCRSNLLVEIESDAIIKIGSTD